MDSTLSKSIRAKSDISLINLLKERDQYRPEAVKIAIDEIKARKGSNGPFADPEIDILISTCENEILEKARKKKERITTAHLETKSPSFKWIWLPKRHIFDLTGYYSLTTIVVITLSFPYFGLESNSAAFWLLMTGISFIPFWQANIISEPQTKRFIHFNHRLIYSATITIIITFRGYFLYNNLDSDLYFWLGLIFGYLFILSISGIFSIPFFFITINRLSQKNWYFISRLRIFTPIMFLVVFTLVVIEEDWFITEKQIVWNEDRPLTFDDFRGYPDFFTHYDAAISSFIYYEFNEKDELITLEARCNTHHTWVDPGDKGSYNLLKHEQYHFNVTEAVTRMARKKILDTLKYGSDKEGIESIIWLHRKILNNLQDQYDSDSDHSVIKDMQGYWQFKIDSLLYELDPYWTSKILEPVLPNDTVKYFRFISSNAKNQIIGKYPLLSGEEKYTAHYKFRFTASGSLYRIDYYKYGKLSLDESHKAASILMFKNFDSETLEFHDVNGQLINNKNGYAMIKTTYVDDQIQQIYFNNKRERCQNKNMVYGVLISLDSLGRYAQKVFLNKKDQRTEDVNGLQVIKYSYEEKTPDFYTGLAYFSFNGETMVDKSGVHETVCARDENGNMTFEGTLDTHNRYVTSGGFAYKERKYDELGHYIELASYDSSSNLVRMSEKNAKLTWSIDRYGNTNRSSSYNANNVLVGDKDGIASYYYKYDTLGHLIVFEKYGTGDEMIFEDGYGKEVREFDSLGRLTTLKNYNAYDYPARSTYNSFCYKLLRDSLGYPFEIIFCNKEMKSDTTNDGVHRILQRFDSAGNLIEKKFYGLEDQLVAVDQDVSIFQYDYDERNNKIESRFYNVKEKLAQANQNVSINKYIFNDKNWITERTYHDSLGQLAPFDGVAKFRWVHDNEGNEIEEWKYDKFDQLLDSGVAVIKNKYDKKGKKIEIRKFDGNLEPIKTQAAIVKITYNGFNEITLEEYFNHLHQPSIYNKDSVHIYRYFYDKNNNYMGKKYIGIDGDLIEVNGVAKILNKRNERGNISSTAYYNSQLALSKDENGVSVYKYEYDEYDRQVDFKYLNTDSLPGRYKGYFSHSKVSRDKAGNIIEKIYHNKSGELTIDSDSIALYRFIYDRNGNYTTQSYRLEEARKQLSGE